MIGRPYNKGFTKPPVGSQIDWGNPLTRNLVFYVPLLTGSSTTTTVGRSAVDLVNGIIGTAGGGTPPTWDENRRAFSCTAGLATGANVLNFGTCPQVQDVYLNTSGASWMFLVFFKGASQSGIACRNDANSVNAGWQIGLSTGFKVSFTREFSTTNYHVTAPAPGAGAWHTIIVTDDSGDLVDIGGTGIYIDGVPQALTLVTAGSGTQGSDAAQNLYLSEGRYNSLTGFDGYIAAAAIWKDRILRADEAYHLGINPFSLLRSPLRILDFVTLAVTENLSDSISLTDACTVVSNDLIGLSDDQSGNWSDSTANSDFIAPPILSDLLILTDQPGIGFGLILSDTISLSDYAQAGIPYSSASIDSIILTDAVAYNVTTFLIESLNDSFSWTDRVDIDNPSGISILGDFTLFTERLNLFMTMSLGSLADQIVLSDNVNLAESDLGMASDSFTFGDSVAYTLSSANFTESLTDSVSLSDSIRVILQGGTQSEYLVDTFNFSDYVEVELKLGFSSYIRRYLNDAIGN